MLSGRKIIGRLVPVLGLGVLLASGARAHCDTMDGPVVTDARAALEKGDPTAALKWVKPDHEPHIRALFEKTVKVRSLGTEAREVADQHFYETLVRIHRAGEGATFTGLKPAGTPVEPGIAAADKVVASGQVEPLVKKASEEVAENIGARFAAVQAAKLKAGESLEAGRAYVAAYVEFTHFLQRFHEAMHAPVHHAASSESPAEH